MIYIRLGIRIYNRIARCKAGIIDSRPAAVMFCRIDALVHILSATWDEDRERPLCIAGAV